MPTQKTFGQVREIPVDVQETRIIPFTLSTPTRDRHHTILNQAGWNLDNYRKNPVVGYMHNLYGDLCNPPNPDDVIAMTKNIAVENGMALVASAVFEPATLNLQADKIFRKILLGTLRAVSVGFLDLGKGVWGTGSEAEGAVNETYRFAGQELLEWSVVNIPSNPDGVKRAMRDQTTTAIIYAFRALGKNFRLSQIEEMRVCDVLNLLDGKDLEIRSRNPEQVYKMLKERQSKADLEKIIETQQVDFRKRQLKFELSDPIEIQKRGVRIEIKNNELNKLGYIKN